MNHTLRYHTCQRSRSKSAPNASVRLGISLLEILIALAVSVIGIFGVLVLIPMSARMAETGLDLDEAGGLGRNALHEFEVRNMRNPATWSGINPQNPVLPGPLPNFTSVTPQPNKSYCIDPEFLARNLEGNPSRVTPGAFALTGAYFPINSSGIVAPPTANQPLWLTPMPSMHRISLGSQPGSTSPMSEALAQEIFTSLDDLEFTVYDDPTIPPLQRYHGEDQFGSSNPPNWNLLLKRASDGEKSWIAMLTPRPSPTGLPESDLYTLYIIVFKNRDSNLTSQLDLSGANPVLISDAENKNLEKWFRIVPSFAGPGIGLNGGEIQISPTVQPADANVGFGDIRDIEDFNRDEWVMVCQRITATRGTYTHVYDLFRWYRVTDVDVINTGGTRFLSLDGPDWFTPNNQSSGNTTFGRIYGVKMPGVLEVYERTVRLEDRSIWAD